MPMPFATCEADVTMQSVGPLAFLHISADLMGDAVLVAAGDEFRTALLETKNTDVKFGSWPRPTQCQQGATLP